MMRMFIAAIGLLLVAGVPAYAQVSAEAKAAVEKAITEMGCTMDVDDDVEAKGMATKPRTSSARTASKT